MEKILYQYFESDHGDSIMTFDHYQHKMFFDMDTINHMLDMAKADKVPDGKYSDAECALWECFRRHLR